jgi:hypothetical protein
MTIRNSATLSPLGSSFSTAIEETRPRNKTSFSAKVESNSTAASLVAFLLNLSFIVISNSLIELGVESSIQSLTNMSSWKLLLWIELF